MIRTSSVKNNLHHFFFIGGLSILLGSCNIGNSEYFTGQLEYIYSYDSRTLDTDSIAAIRPLRGIFSYDLQNYQSRFITPARDTITYHYISASNISIAHNHYMDKWRCEDYGSPTDSIYSYSFYETDEKVLGYECKILEFQSRFANNKYYISTNLQLAPELYENHVAYNWQFYGVETEGGVILKLEHQFENYTMKGIAKSIKKFNPKNSALDYDYNYLIQKCAT